MHLAHWLQLQHSRSEAKEEIKTIQTASRGFDRSVKANHGKGARLAGNGLGLTAFVFLDAESATVHLVLTGLTKPLKFLAQDASKHVLALPEMNRFWKDSTINLNSVESLLLIGHET
jgi:hypothetical protein